MAFGTMGMGFLPTDPRKKNNPKGGSAKAGQDKDSSVLITGNPSSGGVGFASPAATKGAFAGPTVAPAPNSEFMPKTASEIKTLTESRGVAETHQNTGSLAVDFRKSEKTKADAGEQTTSQSRDTKILDARTAREHRRLVTDPAEAEASKFRAQASASKNLFETYKRPYQKSGKEFSHYLDKAKSQGKTSTFSASGGGGTSGISSSGYQAGQRSNLGPDHSWLIPEMNKEFRENEGEGDILALQSLKAHSEAPANAPYKSISDTRTSKSGSKGLGGLRG